MIEGAGTMAMIEGADTTVPTPWPCHFTIGIRSLWMDYKYSTTDSTDAERSPGPSGPS